MTAFEKMKLRENSLGATPREEMINNAKYMVDTLLPDDPSYTQVSIIRSGETVGDINLRMDKRRIKNHAPTMNLHDVLNNDIKFKLGDILYRGVTDEDSVKDEYWICTEENNFHGIQRQGECEECNYLLRWQNDKTLEIIERWCSVRDPYASGIDEGKVVTTGNGKYKITIPHDEETAQLYVDKRFLIDVANNQPIPYKLVKFDSVTNSYASRNEGFLVINLWQDEIVEGDNMELMIANYKKQADEPIPSVGSCRIVHEGQLALKQGGSQRVFRGEFLDTDGNVLDGIAPTWELIPGGDWVNSNQIVILYGIDGSVSIQAMENAAIGSKVLLKMSANGLTHGVFEASVELEIIPAY